MHRSVHGSQAFKRFLRLVDLQRTQRPTRRAELAAKVAGSTCPKEIMRTGRASAILMKSQMVDLVPGLGLGAAEFAHDGRAASVKVHPSRLVNGVHAPILGVPRTTRQERASNRRILRLTIAPVIDPRPPSLSGTGAVQSGRPQ